MWTIYHMISSFFMTTLTIGIFTYWCFKVKWKYSIKNKVVFITGACKQGGLGINLAGIAKTHDAKTIIITSRDVDAGLNALNYLDGVPGKGNIIHVTLDLNWSDEKIKSVVQNVWDKVGHVDVLIANAGVSYRGELLKTSLDVHQNIMQSNYFGNVSLINAMGNLMKTTKSEDGYYIVGITSVQARISIPFRSAYSASKHAFSAFLDCLRAEVANNDIRVLNVSPSYINTNLSRNALRDSGKKHMKLDENTAKGMKPDAAAATIISSIRGGNEELVILNLKSRLAILLRTLVPSLYFYVMRKQAQSSQAY